MVDTLKAPGGQCVELYPDKPIYDIPAVPVCTGQELMERLLRQIRPFAAGMHLGQEVTQVERQENGRFRVVGNAKEVKSADGVLKSISVQGGDGVVRRVDADQLLVFFGLHPKLGPIARWGLELNKRQLTVDTEKFQTSVPGIYAVGDINTYPGKKKLILSGFHEAALAAFAIKEYLEPGKKVPLQYTTTSPIMHERLGVADRPPARANAPA